MKLIRFVAGSVVLLALCASAALGQAQRTFVSGSGSDSNPCSRTAPCRTFAQAISQTNPGGEVLVLDSAGYGAFSIDKSISVISPPGVYAGISVFSGDGIDINAGASDVVILRGLTINNQGAANGLSGIAFNSGAALRVEACTVRGFKNPRTGTARGIASSGVGNLVITDTVISDCDLGIHFEPSGGGARATVDHITIDHCRRGVTISSSSAKATVRDSSITNIHALCSCGSICIDLCGIAVSGGVLDLERCLIFDTDFGVSADVFGLGAGTVSISNCVITRNFTGYTISSGSTIYTRGNNTILGNTHNVGSLTPLSAQ